ncbi:hypothetical protein JTE90_003078 [Oedothorax gibbosus]|uniref:CCHC-type domain-containing protein n=1 Tax=Oedothorax gibbosus TaxID=931172 RepID=A0AAV6TPW8_9ARAC|nr:hypothetical protein JTE90_003078 [Oedothorax gibbosus]
MENTDNVIPNPNKIAGYQTLVPNFDGEVFSNVAYFLKSLEDISTIAQWEDPEIIAVFKSKLKGPALQFFIADPELTIETAFSKIKEKFQNYFAPKSTLCHRQQMFSTCKQFPGESVRSFASRVSNLTITYFGQENAQKPDAAPIVNQTKLAKFLEGLNAPLRRLALSRHPSTFEDAIEKSILDELNCQMTDSLESVNAAHSQPRQTSIESELANIMQKQAEKSNKILETLTEQVKSLSQIKNHHVTPAESARPRTCIHCGRSNHTSANCFSLRSVPACIHCGRSNHISANCFSLRNNPNNPRSNYTTYRTPNERFTNTRSYRDNDRNCPNQNQTSHSTSTRYNQRPKHQGNLNHTGNR